MEIVWVLAAILCIVVFLVIAGIKHDHQTRESTSVQLVESLPAKYEPQVLNRLILPGTVKGIVGIRQWTWTENVLTSRNQKFIWTSSKMTADRIPSKNNQNGIYAYQLGAVVPSWLHHIGIVEMLDHIEVHADGIIRAEKCQILAVIVNWGAAWWAREISSEYNIPVYITSYPEQAFREWLLGPDGMRWLNHNYDLIHAINFKIVEEAEKFLGAK